MFSLEFFAALVALLLIASVRADTNITIDDTDPRIVYQPKWSFQANTDATQDRLNKTTHFTRTQGATGSLTFSGALYVFYMGYGIMDLPSPYIPVTLQTRNGSGITVQCDAYRPKETRAQSILFSSDRLDTTETYTITVTKTNGTDNNSINIDAFVLTQPEGEAVTIFSSSQTPPPVTSLDATSTLSTPSAQTSSVANAEGSNAPPNTAAIAGGILGGIALGIIVAFFVFRWWTKREQQKRGLIGPNGQPTSQYSGDSARYPYLNSAPPYPTKLNGAPPRVRTAARTNRRHTFASSFGRAPPLTPLSTTPGRSSVSGRSEMMGAQRGLGYTLPGPEKAQYLGNSILSGSLISASSPSSYMVPPSPEGTEYYGEAVLPAYSKL